MGNCYAVTSGKGGTGKSTVSVGLAMAFAEMGRKTLLIDMDVGLRCLDVLLGVETRLVFDLGDILAGQEIEDAIYDTYFEDLFLIPAPANVGSLDPVAFKEFSKKITKKYDVVIFDFPAGMDFSLYSCLPKHTIALAVCNLDPVSVRDAATVCENLPFPSAQSRLIINKFQYRPMLKGIYGNIDSIIDRSGFMLVGVVPESVELLYLPVKNGLKNRGRPMAAFRRIVCRLLGMHRRLPKPKKI